LDVGHSGNPPKMSRSGGSEGGLMGAGFWPESETNTPRHEPNLGSAGLFNISA
jgi:hypothetical protein